MAENNTEINYWLVGATYDGDEDQTERFLEEGIWENGYKDKYLDKVMSIKKGDRIAIKSAHTQKNNLPFDNRNLFVSVMTIKAIGTVTENMDDGRNVKVDWQPLEPKKWYFYTDRSTIWYVNQDKWAGKALIDFVFNGIPQDIDKFRNDPVWIDKFGDNPNEIIEKRIARLTWNTNGWIKPSGRKGKSKDKSTHEGKYGFGHEEWLFDTEKLIDGYHYGFLEPVRKQFDAYSGSQYDVWLYSIEDIGNKKNRFIVGKIKQLEVLSKDAANEAYKKYKKNGWLAEMEQQVKSSGGDSNVFMEWSGESLLNIRFLAENLIIEEDYIEAPQLANFKGLSRYTFAKYKDSYYCKETVVAIHKDNFSFTSDNHPNHYDVKGTPRRQKYKREAKNVEVVYQHDLISVRLTEHLRTLYGFENVTPEHNAGYGRNSIDVVVRQNGEFTFYEIKTYNSLKSCIREAIGQLMEYSMWLNNLKAKELIIVSPFLGKIEKVSIYMKHIRKTYNIPLFYQTFDLETNILSEKY